jgi:hypothetical protein
MKQTAVEYLIKEFSNILGKIQTEPLQDLFLIDAIKKAKEMEKQQIIDAYHKGYASVLKVPQEEYNTEKYYNETYKIK